MATPLSTSPKPLVESSNADLDPHSYSLEKFTLYETRAVRCNLLYQFHVLDEVPRGASSSSGRATNKVGMYINI